MGKKRERPSVDTMRGNVEHSYDHRGSTGMYGNFFTEDVPEWIPKSDEHEFILIPFFIKGDDNSVFRKSNPDLNKPFTSEQLEKGNTWDHKLSLYTHYNIGPNKDTIVCPALTLKLPCPMCERRQELFDEKEELDDQGKSTKEIDKRIDALNASKKALYNIICCDSDKERRKGIQVWSAPHPSIEDVLASKARDKRTGEFKAYTVPMEGWNVLFEKEGSRLSTEYKDVDIIVREKKDDFSEEEFEKFEDDAYDFEAIVEVLPYEKLAEMYHGIEKDAPSETAKDREEGDDSIIEKEEKESRRKARENRRNKEGTEVKEEVKEESKPEAVIPEVVPEEVNDGEAPACFKTARFNKMDCCESCDIKYFEECMDAAG